MTKLFRSALLLGAAMAVCTFAVPSITSASSWGVVGTTHVLDASNLNIAGSNFATAPFIFCATSQYHVDVAGALALRVTGATFKGCTSLGVSGHCAVTATPTGFPWTITGLATNDIQIQGFRLDARFTTLIPTGSPICFFESQGATVTGTLNGGTWDAANHQMVFSGDAGLLTHTASAATPVTTSSTLRDTTQTLTLT
jgi:hypothetical protein